MATFKQNLVRARSHIVMVIALISGLSLVFWLEGLEFAKSQSADPLLGLSTVAPLPLATPRPLTQTEKAAAVIAWRYFENNINTDTGFVGSVDKYPSTTLWEMGTLFVSVVAAERLDLITKDVAMAHMTKALDSLGKIRLLDEGLPNKVYDIRDLEMVNYENKPSARGLGWSVLDLGRLLSSFAIAQRAHPELAVPINGLLSKWNLSKAFKQGELNGANIKDGVVTEHQEGRIGYEQYVAKAMMAFGFDASRAMEVTGHLAVQDVNGQSIPIDARLNRNLSPAITTSEPYILDGLEFGFDWRSHIFGSQVYRAQEQRFIDTGIKTAVSEGHINVAPYFAYATVWGGGQPWAVMSFTGERIDSKRTLSTKAAFAWDALFNTEYTQKLVGAVSKLNDPLRGWQEGVYEIDNTVNTSVTANTNGIVLTSLAYRAGGPMLKFGK